MADVASSTRSKYAAKPPAAHVVEQQFNCHADNGKRRHHREAHKKRSMKSVLPRANCYTATVPRNGPQVTRW
jgi:hypothetical protein